MVERQQLALRLYSGLWAARPDWRGKWIVVRGINEPQRAFAAAASIAGAAALFLEEDTAMARAAMREGFCDFVVTSLDEALRILKNEIRKHRPILVCVTGIVEQNLAELTERGVAADLHLPDLDTLVAKGDRLAAENAWQMVELARMEEAQDALLQGWAIEAPKFFRPPYCVWHKVFFGQVIS